MHSDGPLGSMPPGDTHNNIVGIGDRQSSPQGKAEAGIIGVHKILPQAHTINDYYFFISSYTCSSIPIASHTARSSPHS